MLYDGSDDVLVLSNERSELWQDMYRLNTRDGRKTLLTRHWPGDPVRWVADRKGVVRGAMTTEKGGLVNRSWWRPSADAKWQHDRASTGCATHRLSRSRSTATDR